MTEDRFKKDISVMKLINYNLIFFIPLIILYLLAHYVSGYVAPKLEVNQGIATQIIMLVLSLITFFVLIPFLRIRESIKGVRFSLFNFVIMGFVITIPSLIKGNYGILMSALIYLANFLFATFINCPDVIGITGDPEDWFKHKVQIMIFVIYLSIILLYIFGFSWIYFQMANDSDFPNSFKYDSTEKPSYFTFTYYSIVTMATVGYGDITPISNGARLVITLQILVGMIINIVFIAILIMYVTHSQAQAERKIEQKIQQEERKIEQEERKIEEEEKKIEEERAEEEQEAMEDLVEKYPRLSNTEFSQYRAYPNYMDGERNKK